MEQQKEMNLFELCGAAARGIGNAVVWFVKLLGKMVKLTYRQWWVVLIVVVLVAAAALYDSREDNRQYEVNAIAILNGPLKDVVEREYLSLNHSNAKFEKQNLEYLLQLSPDIASKISHFAAFDVIDLMGDSVIDMVDFDEKIPTMDSMYVHVPYMLALQYRTKLPNANEQVQGAILNYLNSRPSISAPYEQFHANLTRSARFHHDQLEKLDSLTSAFYFNHNNLPQATADIWHSGMILGAREIDLFLEEIIDEMETLNFTDMRLVTATAPVVLQTPFIVDAKAINGPLKGLAVGLVLGWLLGLLVAALVDNRKDIILWLKS